MQESKGRWIERLEYGKRGFIELMQAWRYAVIAYLAEALKGDVLTSELSTAELGTIFEAQYKRAWHIDISRRMSKAHFLRYVGRYIRRPPIAQHHLDRVTDQEVEYLAKDTRNHNQLVRVRHSNEKLVAILKEQVPDRGRHAMRYFGLLAPPFQSMHVGGGVCPAKAETASSSSPVELEMAASQDLRHRSSPG
jgi:hypothetical protein